MSPPDISFLDLLYFSPFVGIAAWLTIRWSPSKTRLFGALLRMLVQLTAVGFVLSWVFANKQLFVILGILTVMLFAAAMIAVSVKEQREPKFAGLVGRETGFALIAITLAAVPILAVVILAILRIDPWFEPRFLLPLAGMVIASAMNPVSLAAERWQSGLDDGKDCQDALHQAFQAAMIPPINSCMAVGVVSLPGMMTGQILAGADPFVAARYQILIMLMTVSAAAIAAGLYLALSARALTPQR